MSPMDVVRRIMALAVYPLLLPSRWVWDPAVPLLDHETLVTVGRFTSAGGVRPLSLDSWTNARGRTLTVGAEWVTIS